MRIIYHQRTMGDGAEGVHVREMVQAFKAMGHSVIMAGPMFNSTITNKKAQSFSGLLTDMKRYLFNSMYEIFELLYTGLCFLQLSFLVLRYKPDFLYDRYMIYNAGPVLVGKFFRLPVLLEVNAPLALEREVQPEDSLTFKRLAYAMERWVVKNASRVIVVSTSLKKYFEKQGIPEFQCLVFPNGANPNTFKPMPKNRELIERIGVKPKDFIVGFSGILRQWHGLDFFIDSIIKVAQDHKLFVLIVGDGPSKNFLENKLRKSILNNSYCITGRIMHEDVPAYVNLFDLAVCPRSTFYASPMKIVEYMALNKAIMAPRTENIMDLITDGNDGILFEENNSLDFCEKLYSLIDDPKKRCVLGQKARQKVEDDLNWQRTAGKIISLVNTLLLENGQRNIHL